jgi:signal recognition particle subunit SRP54
MLETLTDRLGNALRNVRGVGKLSEKNMEDTFKDVRAALLTADVHFRVAREFIERVSSECIGQKVTQSVTPGQMLVKIIHDELVHLLGEGSNDLIDKRPLRIMMIGLHGSGKTTSSVKLARYLHKKGYTPLLVACDLYRPAAIEQLETLAGKEDFHFYAEPSSKDVIKVAANGLTYAKKNKTDAIIFDTAGRLQIDDELVEEIKLLKKRIVPDEVLLVADSALGQEAVNISKTFHEALNLTGIVLTKLDGDARGGAALSMKAITNIPIKFIGIGEKVDELELFHPDRMASRILGMGDVVTLVEKAQETIDEEEAIRMAEKMRKADFNYEDMLAQFKQLKKMGSLGSIVDMLPGMNNVEIGDKEEDQLKRTEAIILSMTTRERQNPNLLNGRRRMRIAAGSGVEIREVNALIKQFTMMRKMMRKMKGAKGKKMLKKMQSMGGDLPGMGGNLPGMNV